MYVRAGVKYNIVTWLMFLLQKKKKMLIYIDLLYFLYFSVDIVYSIRFEAYSLMFCKPIAQNE